MFHLRRRISRWGLSPHKRENLLWGLGNAIWRTLKRGIIHTAAQLRQLVAELIASLQSAPEGVSATLRRACGYAGALTLMALESLGIAPGDRVRKAVDRKEALRRKLEALRLQYLQPWLSLEERARIAEEGRRIAAALREEEETGLRWKASDAFGWKRTEGKPKGDHQWEGWRENFGE